MTDTTVDAEPDQAAEPTPGDEPTPHLPVPAGYAADPHPPVTGELPTVPERNELEAMAQLANTFAHARLVPKALQGQPADCLLVLMTARDLGLSMTVAFRELHPIDGRVTASPKLKLAIVRQRGLGRVWPAPDNGPLSATWYATRADDPDTTYASTFTIEDARSARLLGKDNWKMYPARMLSWRALGYLLDDAFSEVGTGLYSADELGAVTDSDGKVIDIAEAGGVGSINLPAQGQQQGATGNAAPAADADRFDLQFDIYALPPDQVHALGDQWRRAQLPNLWNCTRGQLRTARGLLNAQVANARRAQPDYDHPRYVAQLRTDTWERLVQVLCGAYGPHDDGLPAEPEFDVDPPAPPAPDGGAASPAPEPEEPQATGAASPAAEPAPDPAPAPGRATPGPDRLVTLREQVTADVEALSVAEVLAELQQMQPPVPIPDGAQAQRAALVTAEVQRQLLASLAAEPEGVPDA